MKRYLLYVMLVVCTSQSTSYGQIIKVEETKNYDALSLKKLGEAVRLLDSVLATEDFRTRVVNASYVGAKGKTGQQLYDYLMSGNSKYDSSNDKIINLYLAAYSKYAGGGELGMTRGRVTSTHRCFILKNDVRCLAGHLLHEYLHVMGFHHRKIASETPKLKTVPYVIGNIVKKMLSSPGCPAIKKTCN